MGVSQSAWKKGRRGQNTFTTIQKVNMKNGLRLGFRSGLEADNAKFLETKGQPIRFEAIKIPFTVPITYRKYTPDFVLRNGIIVETKGKLEPKDRAKHMLIAQQHPELDIRFVFQRPHDKIVKGSKTTYAAWCDKHGFKWAARVIPEHWLIEDGPARSPDDVLKELESKP